MHRASASGFLLSRIIGSGLVSALAFLQVYLQASKAEAQIVSPGAEPAEEQFLQGYWVTNGQGAVAPVAAGLPPTDEPITFEITSGQDPSLSEVKHRIFTEEEPESEYVVAGGSGLTEGRSIEIRQETLGRLSGAWRAITQPVSPSGYTKIRWIGSHQSLSHVAKLSTPRRFVLSFTDPDEPKCRLSNLVIFVDNKPLLDLNKQIIRLAAGGSIYSYGSRIAVLVSTACLNGPNPPKDVKFAGTLKVVSQGPRVESLRKFSKNIEVKPAR